MRQVEYRGAQDRKRIDALVQPEILILGGYEGLLHHVRHRRIRDEDAALGGKFRHQPCVAGEDPAHHRGLVIPQAIHIGKVGAESIPREVAAGATQQNQQRAYAEETSRHSAQKTVEPAAARSPCNRLL